MPYVGADYATATASWSDRAGGRGHRAPRLCRAGAWAPSPPSTAGGASPSAPRRRRAAAICAPTDGPPARSLERPARRPAPPAVFVAELADAVAVGAAARARGLRRSRRPVDRRARQPPGPVPDRHRFTTFRSRARRWAAQAARCWPQRLEGSAEAPAGLLPCEPVEGETLGAPSGDADERDRDVREILRQTSVIGGGLGGVAAALGALRAGRTVVMTEEYDWIGGQLTSQAVPPDEHSWVEQFGITAQLPRAAQRHPPVLPRPLSADRGEPRLGRPQSRAPAACQPPLPRAARRRSR